MQKAVPCVMDFPRKCGKLQHTYFKSKNHLPPSANIHVAGKVLPPTSRAYDESTLDLDQLQMRVEIDNAAPFNQLENQNVTVNILPVEQETAADHDITIPELFFVTND